jgi:3-hydroxyethyl bacteriochlorophyllide a dehydrogenase
MQARVIVFTGVNQVEVQPVEIPAPGPGEVLLEAAYTLISPGTELRCRAGKQDGAVFPFIPGYSFAGKVIACGKDTTLKEGTYVYGGGTAKASIARTWGGHVSHAVHFERDLYPLPAGVNPLWGAGARLVAIAYRGVRLGEAKPHETVAVIGLGAIGQCSARLHTLTGARVVAADLSPFRVEITQKAGIQAFVPQGSLVEAFARVLPNGADVVVDATGVSSVLSSTLEVAKPKAWDDLPVAGARVIIQGSYPADFNIPYMAAFMKELSFWVPRDVQPSDIRIALELMARSKMSMEGIISEVRAPETAADTYAALADPQSRLMTVAFKWN